MNPQNLTVPASEFTEQLNPQNAVNTTVQLFDLELDDDKLLRITANQLEADIQHWEQEPWLLSLTDKENIAYLLGIQADGKVANTNTQTPYVDNRLFTAVRAILAYATGQTAKPELLPSKPDDKYQTIARQTGQGLYQHAQDHEVNQEMRLALKNLITRKRGYIKLRYDEDYGAYGDICTENVDPSDIIIGRFSRFQRNPDRIFHKQVGSVQELCDKFPDAKEKIYEWAGIQRGVFSQTSRVVSYWECWFTYFDKDGEEAEGVCWFIPNSGFILGKMQNPNWLYSGSKKSQLIKNLTYCPIKPFIILNYWNTGRSAIDETCLFDQARPQQDILNKRGRQIVENADFANPRLLVNGALFEESDAKKFVNKSPKTIGVLNNMTPEANINNAVMVIPPTQLSSFVMEDKYDARNEIDTMMGTPTQFRGSSAQSKNPTLGQDLMVKNQASALQDDLVAVVHKAWRQYYLYLLQMMNVYLPDDYYVMTRGQNGEYNHIMLSSDHIDSNVRMSVREDSTLPLDKESQRATAVQLAQMNRLDDLSLFELLGMPEPQKLAERKLRWEIDRYTYMQSVEQKLMSNEAEQDIRLLINGKTPEERDDYNEDYLNHFNIFISRNEFHKLPMPVQNRLTDWLHQIANKAAITEGLRDSMLNPAGIIDRPPVFPLPQRRIDYRVNIQGGPNDAAQVMPEAGAPPVTQVQNGGSPPAPTGQPSPPRVVNPNQFGVK